MGIKKACGECGKCGLNIMGDEIKGGELEILLLG